MATALFPLNENESIGSNLGRYADFVGLENTLMLRRRLFGHACRPNTKLPSGVSHLAEETKDYWGLNAFEIINYHTEFHYATLTLLKSRKDKMLLDMLAQPAGRCLRRTACGWIGERVCRFRYCEICLAEWRAKRISPYWMVKHQLPGVYFCFLHSAVLKVVKSSIPKCFTDPPLANLNGKTDTEIVVSASFAQRSAIEDIARNSARYSEGRDALPSPAVYRDLLKEAGLIWPSGRMDHRRLVACLLTYFGREYCQLVGLNWQKLAVWSRNITESTMDCESSHAFMFVATESFLNRRCASPGSFVPGLQSADRVLVVECSKVGREAIVPNTSELSCVGILHRAHDTWEVCAREGTGWTLVCSCGASYHAANASGCGNVQLSVRAYGLRYERHVCRMLANGVSVDVASRQFHMTVAAFLQWVHSAGLCEKKSLSQPEIKSLRDRWCRIVQNARPDKRITSAYRVDPKLYRMLCRYDHAWFAAFNLEHRTRPNHSLANKNSPTSMIHRLNEERIDLDGGRSASP